MLDENLPTFYLKQAPDQIAHHKAYYLTYRGSDPEPAYNITHPDPSSPSGKNCYAAALFDSYSPEILYGEVLIRPAWTQPSLSQEEIRRNGGVPPPPQPIQPTEFTVQLYNPDQQIVVREKKAGWGGTPSYTFSMPQQTFRMPSVSALDRQQHDPSADATTPQINFQWKREGKLSKDMACYMTGKSNEVVKKKHKEPDIIVSMFQSLREVTIYESNYHRIEIEDPKGLEVVLLLTAAVLKDVFFTPLREAFNVSENEQRTVRKHSSSINLFNGGLQRKQSPTQATHLEVPTASGALSAPPSRSGPMPAPQSAAMGGLYATPTANADHRQNLPHLRTASAPPQNAYAPPADPRTQWEIDNETARLRAASDAQRRALEVARREQEKLDAAEAKRLQKHMEAQEKERRRKQAEIDKETERLRKKYGNQADLLPPLPPPRTQYNQAFLENQQWQTQTTTQPSPRPQQQSGWHGGPYMAPQAAQSSVSTNSLASNGLPIRPGGGVKPKRSFWGLGSSSNVMSGALPAEERQRNLVRRKSSSVF